MLVFLAVFFYRVAISGTVALWRRSGATFLTCLYFDSSKALEGFKIGKHKSLLWWYLHSELPRYLRRDL